MNTSLVAYFSATGTTERVAETLATAVHGELFAIEPETAYTSADLNWNNKQSRSSVEMSDMSSRPVIKSKVKSMDQYDVIYVGFPIWWYRAPSIINTFLESYNLTDKIIIPFATSGGSQMGNTNAALSPSCVGAILKEGRRFSAHVTESELAQWSKGLLNK